MDLFKKPSKGLLFALSASSIWACGIVVGRYILKAGENPLNLTAWVSLMTFIPWLFLFQRHVQEFKRLSHKNIVLLAFIGIAASMGINYLQALALANTSAVNFSFLYRTVIIFTIVFAWIFFKEKITRKKILLLVFILGGSYLVTTNGQGFSLSPGDLYTLLMAASAAFISNILIKHTVSKMHTDLSGSVTSIVACLSLLFLATMTHVLRVPQQLFWVFITSVLYFAMIMFRNRAYKIATASFVTMIFALTPFFVTILSFIFLRETLEPVQLIGGLLIVGSAVLVERYKM